MPGFCTAATSEEAFTPHFCEQARMIH